MFTWLSRSNEGYTPLPRSATPPPLAQRQRRPSSTRRMVAACLVSTIVGVVLTTLALSPLRRPVTHSGGSMWGRHEQLGWTQLDETLLDPGATADDRIVIGFDAGFNGTSTYFNQLHDFAATFPAALAQHLHVSLHHRLPASHARLLPAPPRAYRPGPPGMTSYKHIFQTDKTAPKATEAGSLTALWADMNAPDGWTLEFYDDDQADAWVKETFADSKVSWAWDAFGRGVLKADLLRYLLPLVRGGVYSDTDTEPLRRIEAWGRKDVEVLDLSVTDGPDWLAKQTTEPAVIIAIESDVHAIREAVWAAKWPRAMGMCQWTLSSAPYHPIMLDVTRRVVNHTHIVDEWESQRTAEVAALRESGDEVAADELLGKPTAEVMPIVEWTGPAAFTDAVLAYLLARYQVTWRRLRGLNHPLRIGDVLVLPITGFSPGGEWDFHAAGRHSPQADVVHHFRGGWKADGW